jgi:hypothetical protein
LTDDTAPAWANGVTLKRTSTGYSWTVSVAAATDELEALRQAIATARQIDDDLAAVYGPLREPGRPKASTEAREGR